jgi:hypothetical protein
MVTVGAVVSKIVVTVLEAVDVLPAASVAALASSEKDFSPSAPCQGHVDGVAGTRALKVGKGNAICGEVTEGKAGHRFAEGDSNAGVARPGWWGLGSAAMVTVGAVVSKIVVTVLEVGRCIARRICRGAGIEREGLLAVCTRQGHVDGIAGT